MRALLTTLACLTLAAPALAVSPDADNNGVRDDIDRWILQRYPDPIQRISPIRYARGLQLAIDRSMNARQAAENETLQSARLGCLKQDLPKSWEAEAALIRGMTLDTPERRRSYSRYQGKLRFEQWASPTQDCLRQR